MHVAALEEAQAFVTLDGSTIRELAGRVSLPAEKQSLAQCVVIPPGAIHKLVNTGDDPLRLLCCCAPAYSDDDTVLTGG
jgi:oxalate decarboxylase/phosphoglucose isomerase-like protein (cupin superfamily)